MALNTSKCNHLTPLPFKGLTWRPTANLNETALGLSAAQMRAPKNFSLSLTARHAALSGNASLTAIIVLLCL